MTRINNKAATVFHLHKVGQAQCIDEYHLNSKDCGPFFTKVIYMFSNEVEIKQSKTQDQVLIK